MSFSCDELPETITREFFINSNNVALELAGFMQRDEATKKKFYEIQKFQRCIEKSYFENKQFYLKLIVRNDFQQVFKDVLVDIKLEDPFEIIWKSIIHMALDKTIDGIERGAAENILGEMYGKLYNHFIALKIEEYETNLASSKITYYLLRRLHLMLIFSVSTHKFQYWSEDLFFYLNKWVGITDDPKVIESIISLTSTKPEITTMLFSQNISTLFHLLKAQYPYCNILTKICFLDFKDYFSFIPNENNFIGLKKQYLEHVINKAYFIFGQLLASSDATTFTDKVANDEGDFFKKLFPQTAARGWHLEHFDDKRAAQRVLADAFLSGMKSVENADQIPLFKDLVTYYFYNFIPLKEQSILNKESAPNYYTFDKLQSSEAAFLCVINMIPFQIPN